MKRKNDPSIVHYNPDFNTNDLICQLYPSFVSNFKSKTQKMAQEPYFVNSDQSCKSKTTLKNSTNIFGNNLLPNWLCLLLIPCYFPSLLKS